MSRNWLIFIGVAQIMGGIWYEIVLSTIADRDPMVGITQAAGGLLLILYRFEGKVFWITICLQCFLVLLFGIPSLSALIFIPPDGGRTAILTPAIACFAANALGVACLLSTRSAIVASRNRSEPD